MILPFRRKTLRTASSRRIRPQVTALEGRLVPSTITEFALPPLSLGGSFGATAITAGPDGNVWFADPGAHAVGRITPSGQVTEFPSPIDGPGVITAGSDGNVWFSSGDISGSPVLSTSPAIGRITTSGQITTFPVPDEIAGVTALTAGPDSSVWFTEFVYPNGERVGRITLSGQITQFAVTVPPGSSVAPGDITAGPDGNLYFSHDGVLASTS